MITDVPENNMPTYKALEYKQLFKIFDKEGREAAINEYIADGWTVKQFTVSGTDRWLAAYVLFEKWE